MIAGVFGQLRQTAVGIRDRSQSGFYFHYEVCLRLWVNFHSSGVKQWVGDWPAR